MLTRQQRGEAGARNVQALASQMDHSRKDERRR